MQMVLGPEEAEVSFWGGIVGLGSEHCLGVWVCLGDWSSFVPEHFSLGLLRCGWSCMAFGTLHWHHC